MELMTKIEINKIRFLNRNLNNKIKKTAPIRNPKKAALENVVSKQSI
jgi:hypothetical protein